VSGQPQAGHDTLELVPQGNSNRVRFLHVFSVTSRGDQASLPRSELVEKDGQLGLTISTEQQTFRLTLPSVNIGAGDIAISDAGGRTLLGPRPLASGILPHGVEGVRLLEQWDVDYRHGHTPLWDAGTPSGELRRVVEDGTIRACRVVELGCGSGTDAVYLASRGFDVTAIDIAPSALSQAAEKARQAGVQVQWLLADVLAAPKLDPFDFIYDRGCYHEVRAQNLAAYLETLRRFSRPGTRFVLLAGNANEVLDYGPPRVTEEELRNDFSPLFEFEWLKESRFEIARPGAMGPLAWSALMRRKSGGRSAR
jgi:SAM-dependent methyltransferase